MKINSIMRTLALTVASLAWTLPAEANSRPHYYLPYERDVTRTVSVGNSAGRHDGIDEHAWDFVGDNWLVRAARTGKVVAFRDTKGVGGCSDSYSDDANYVRLLHDDGTETLYTHLKQGSVSALGVGTGDILTRYRPLGRTDSSGYVCGQNPAHLHYQVQANCSTSDGFCQSTSSSFLDSDVLIQHANGIPVSGDAVESSDHPEDRADLSAPSELYGDAKIDLNTLNAAPSGTDVAVMLSNGTNAFGPAGLWRDLTWGWSGIKALNGDVNGDGNGDLVTLNGAPDGTDVMVMLASGTSFAVPTKWRDLTWGWSGIKPVMGDVNKDGRSDLITLNGAPDGTDVMVMLSTGTSFATPTQWRDLTWGWSGIKAVSGDVNADWKTDLVTLNGAPDGTDVMVMSSNGTNGFGTPTQWRDLGWDWNLIKPLMADLNGDTPDGKADLLTLNGAPDGTDVAVMLSNGTNGFGTPTLWADLSWGWSGIKPLIGDVNGDGNADLISLNGAPDGTDVVVLKSNGTNAFGLPALWQDLTWGWSGILVPY